MKTNEEDIEELGQKLQFMKSMGYSHEAVMRALSRGIARILVRNAVRAILGEDTDLNDEEETS